MELGKEIRRLRNSRGLTQEAMAAALHVTAQTVSKWECGTTLPDVQMLPELAVYFGVTIDQLFAMDPAEQMERMENRIYNGGLLDAAEERQMEEALQELTRQRQHAGRAWTLLALLHNHQAEQHRLLAVQYGREAAEETKGDRDALSELANAWGSYMPDWNVRNHHALIQWFTDFARRHPENRAAIMWLLDNLIADCRLDEARRWVEQLSRIDDTYRTPLYRYLIAQAAGERAEAEELLGRLEAMEDQEWSWALTLGDICTLRQDYDAAIDWYRKGQALQPSPKFTDGACSIAHICEIRGDREGAIAAYREVLRLMGEEWGIVSGEEREEIERAIRQLQ